MPDQEDHVHGVDEPEQTVWDGRPSLRVVWLRLGFLLALILFVETVLIVFFGLSGHWSRLLVYMAYTLSIPLVAGCSLVRQMSKYYRVTTKCIYTRSGILKRTDNQVDLRNYRDIRRVEPSVWSRMLRIADITIEADSDDDTVFRDIEQSESVFELLRQTGYDARGHVVVDGVRGRKPGGAVGRKLKAGEETRHSGR